LRELSVSHIAVFVRPRTGLGLAASKELAEAFMPGKDLSVSIELRGRILQPCRARVRTYDESWIRGYRFIVVAEFLGLTREQKETLEALILEEKKRTHCDVKPEMSKPSAMPCPVTGGEAVRVTFPARRGHSTIFRSLCEGLAQQAGFSPRDVFLIKLAADEVFTNAVIHGSACYGVSRICAHIILDNDGITVLVRDEGGLPFNYSRHQSGCGERAKGSVKSGLDIIDRVMDSWTVRTEQGKYTEVLFRKKRIPHG